LPGASGGHLSVEITTCDSVVERPADRGAAGQRVITGTVIEWQVAELISVANQQTDPGGVRIALRKTVYECDPRAIKPGIRVTVWYRSVGERRPVADKVRVLNDATH